MDKTHSLFPDEDMGKSYKAQKRASDSRLNKSSGEGLNNDSYELNFGDCSGSGLEKEIRKKICGLLDLGIENGAEDRGKINVPEGRINEIVIEIRKILEEKEYGLEVGVYLGRRMICIKYPEDEKDSDMYNR
ncbi:MAG TPA: hypothetical protein ENI70_00605 [Candidatus Peregrinibacteria bacterium]|nr:hypothetical protein [Candidatus Peregrinibacteria bacterium]